MTLRSIVLLAVRLYIGINLLYVAKQGGLAKYNMGPQSVADNVVAKVGTPFSLYPLQFAYAVIAAEFLGSLGMIFGIFSKTSGLLIGVNFSVACYAQMYVWGGDFDSLLYSPGNVHGALVYGLAGFFIYFFGAGSFSVEGLLGMTSTEKSKKE